MSVETQALSADVEKYNGLNQKIGQLESKKISLKRITESKLVRFLPIILLENIQNLKPSGVWLTGLTFVDKKSDTPMAGQRDPSLSPPTNAAGQTANPTAAALVDAQGSERPFDIEIIGSAASNVLIAEFMMALKTTQNQSYEQTDLRTQLFFSDVVINFSQISSQKADAKTSEHFNFKLQLNSRERNSGDADNSGRFTQFIDDFRRNGQASMN
jgi:hypothetical protein